MGIRNIALVVGSGIVPWLLGKSFFLAVTVWLGLIMVDESRVFHPKSKALMIIKS